MGQDINSFMGWSGKHSQIYNLIRHLGVDIAKGRTTGQAIHHRIVSELGLTEDFVPTMWVFSSMKMYHT